MTDNQTFKEMGVNSFPLSWPEGWKRAAARGRSQFRTPFARARSELFHELSLLGCPDWNVILSSNIPLRRDGLPYAGQANPEDPGVAVYFRLKNKPMVFACDQYITATDNLYAITKTIEALRGIKRWGASDMMERSFSGFAALPPAKSEVKMEWWEVLGVLKNATPEQIKVRWKTLAYEFHPDREGGSEVMMKRINAAYAEATK